MKFRTWVFSFLTCLSIAPHPALAGTSLGGLEARVQALFPAGPVAGKTPDGRSCTVKFGYTPYEQKYVYSGAMIGVYDADGSSVRFQYDVHDSRHLRVAAQGPLSIHARNAFHGADSGWQWTKESVAVTEAEPSEWQLDVNYSGPQYKAAKMEKKCIIPKKIEANSLPIQGLQALWTAVDAPVSLFSLETHSTVPCAIRELGVVRTATLLRLLGVHYQCGNESGVIHSASYRIEGHSLRFEKGDFTLAGTGTISDTEFTIDNLEMLEAPDPSWQMMPKPTVRNIIHAELSGDRIGFSFTKQRWERNRSDPAREGSPVQKLSAIGRSAPVPYYYWDESAPTTRGGW